MAENNLEETEKVVGTPPIENYDATAVEAQAKDLDYDTVQKLWKHKVAERRRNLSTIAKARILLGLFCWMAFVYLATFYTFTFIEDGSAHIIDALKGTASGTYAKLADQYTAVKSPVTAQEVADLVTELYELLAEMGYYNASIINRPPHVNPSMNQRLAEQLGYSSAAISMMEMLPYLNQTRGDGDTAMHEWIDEAEFEFIAGGIFLDLRDDGSLQWSRDPYSARSLGVEEDEEPYMLPNYVSLSIIREETSMMVLNVENMKLWTIDYWSGNIDPVLQGIPDGDDTGLPFYTLEKYPSRLARDALRDYINKFRTLEWMPGGQYNGSWDGDEHARLYRENGWPDNFNATALDIARLNWREHDENAREEAERPFQKVLDLERNWNGTLSSIERGQQKIVASDKGIVDSIYVADHNNPNFTKLREEGLANVKEHMRKLPGILEELEAAREALASVDSTVKKARENRIAKYGF